MSRNAFDQLVREENEAQDKREQAKWERAEAAKERLSAAAPDLLKALVALLAYHEKPVGFEKAVLMDNEQFGSFLSGIKQSGDEVTASARAAIAKARGEA